jgi:hypothetical protein
MELSALISRIAMKERFPIPPRNVWRRRFLAIARELEAAGTPRRDSLDVPRTRPRPALRCR